MVAGTLVVVAARIAVVALVAVRIAVVAALVAVHTAVVAVHMDQLVRLMGFVGRNLDLSFLILKNKIYKFLKKFIFIP